MHYVEYATSAGPGTLIEHGVMAIKRPFSSDYYEHEFAGKLHMQEHITPERYSDFIAIHGGERAV